MTRKAQGFALIDLLFVCGIIGVLSAIALPRLSLAKAAAGAASAIGSMRAINSSELTFALTCGSGFYAPNLSTLGTAPPGSNDAFIAPALGAADTITKVGYIIQVHAVPYAVAPATCNGLPAGSTGQGFKAAADPAAPENPRYFATNAGGQIFENTSSLYALMPEADEPAAGRALR
jgi:type II secretory pathway pseudopilin PulG